MNTDIIWLLSESGEVVDVVRDLPPQKWIVNCYQSSASVCGTVVYWFLIGWRVI